MAVYKRVCLAANDWAGGVLLLVQRLPPFALWRELEYIQFGVRRAPAAPGVMVDGLTFLLFDAV